MTHNNQVEHQILLLTRVSARHFSAAMTTADANTHMHNGLNIDQWLQLLCA